MTKFALAAAVATAVLALAASSANAGGCDDWGCGTNGPQLTGIDGSKAPSSPASRHRASRPGSPSSLP